MGNMSYCMFRNTLNDLRECVRRMENAADIEAFLQSRDADERRAFDALVKECRNFADDYADLVRQKTTSTK